MIVGGFVTLSLRAVVLVIERFGCMLQGVGRVSCRALICWSFGARLLFFLVCGCLIFERVRNKTGARDKEAEGSPVQGRGTSEGHVEDSIASFCRGKKTPRGLYDVAPTTLRYFVPRSFLREGKIRGVALPEPTWKDQGRRCALVILVATVLIRSLHYPVA